MSQHGATLGIMKHFSMGFKSVLPIIPGVLPFGAIMGSVFAEAKLSFWQAMLMNTSVYAGASQLATIELMSSRAALFVVVGTGVIINLRFLLYSAALSPHLKDSGLLTKFFCAFTLTDQSYAAVSASQEKCQTNDEMVQFYLGTAVCMFIAWHSSVILGYVFGNFAPAALSLDFAVPLSFVALLIPTLRDKSYVAVAVFSAVISLVFVNLPLKTGIIVTALLSILLAWVLIKKKRS